MAVKHYLIWSSQGLSLSLYMLKKKKQRPKHAKISHSVLFRYEIRLNHHQKGNLEAANLREKQEKLDGRHTKGFQINFIKEVFMQDTLPPSKGLPNLRMQQWGAFSKLQCKAQRPLILMLLPALCDEFRTDTCGQLGHYAFHRVCVADVRCFPYVEVLWSARKLRISIRNVLMVMIIRRKGRGEGCANKVK